MQILSNKGRQVLAQTESCAAVHLSAVSELESHVTRVFVRLEVARFQTTQSFRDQHEHFALCLETY